MSLLPKPLAYAIMGMVSLVWGINFGAQFFIEGFQPDPYIHGIFMAIVGGAMALSRKAGNAEPEAPPPQVPEAPPQVPPGQGSGPT